jgi:hypothetical protein
MSAPKAAKSSASGALFERVKKAILDLNAPGGATRGAVHKALGDAALSEADVLAALNRGAARGALTKAGARFYVTGAPPPPPPPPPAVGIEDLVVGGGAAAARGAAVTVSYVGTLAAGGAQFDAAAKFVFELGAGDVIKGWDLGVAGMRVGGKRRLTVPAALGYGKRGSPPEIPGDATLIFDITLLAVK